MSANSARTASGLVRATHNAVPARSVTVKMATINEQATQPAPHKLIAKHNEFDKVASMMIGAQRSIETTPRGIEQIVVTAPGSILRWPTSYARGEAP